MHQHFNGDPPQRVERTQDVEGRRGVETEYRLPAIQYYKGLGKARQFRKDVIKTFAPVESTCRDIMKIKHLISQVKAISTEAEYLDIRIYQVGKAFRQEKHLTVYSRVIKAPRTRNCENLVCGYFPKEKNPPPGYLVRVNEAIISHLRSEGYILLENYI